MISLCDPARKIAFRLFFSMLYTQQSACHYGGWADLLDEKEYEISQLSFDWLSEQKGIKIRLSGRFKRHKQIEYETSMIVPLLNGAKE